MSDEDIRGGSASGRTFVEEGTEITGSLRSTVPVTVRGSVDGEVAAPSLVVSATGRVKGNAKVDELVSEGEIAGNFDAATIRLSGVVRDDTVLRAKTLEVRLASEDGLVVAFGRTSLQVGNPPPRGEDAKGKGRGA
jgi:cytoskeletal protein CcmA (bactofilin family)